MRNPSPGTRRNIQQRFLACGIGISLALVGTAVGCSSTPTHNPARDKAPAPMTVLIVGDSMAGGFFGKALADELASRPGVDVQRVYVISTGLSGLHPFNWTARTEELMTKFHPDVLIALYGANDTLAVREATGKDYLFNHPEYRARYARHVHEYVKRFAPRLKRLYLIGQPATDHHSLSVRYPVANDVYREVCSRFPNARYVPTWELTTVKGKYAPFLADRDGKLQKVKYGDAVHPTPAGGKIMTDAVLPYFLGELDLREAPTPALADPVAKPAGKSTDATRPPQRLAEKQTPSAAKGAN